MVVWHMTPELAYIVPGFVLTLQKNFPTSFKIVKWWREETSRGRASKYYNYTEAQAIFVTLVTKAKYADQCGNF